MLTLISEFRDITKLIIKYRDVKNVKENTKIPRRKQTKSTNKQFPKEEIQISISIQKSVHPLFFQVLNMSRSLFFLSRIPIGRMLGLLPT